MHATLRRLAFATACLLPLHAAIAADPVKLIVPTPPGGGTDGFFRLIAQEAEKNLGQPLVITNVGGAGGTIGVSQLVRAAPDGNTIAGVWLSPITVSPHTVKTSYTLDDFIAVAQLSSAPYVLCVRPDFPANTGREFIEVLKKNPGKYTYGTDGVAGPGQLSTERVFQALGIKQVDVPYKGAGETSIALLSKTIDIYSGSVPPGVNFERNKQGKCLLATSPERLKALPDAISLGELGIPNESTALWRAIIVPKGTPPEKVAKIRDAFVKAAESESVKQFIEAAGESVQIQTGAELDKHLRTEYAAFGALVKKLDLKPNETPAK